MSEYRTMEDGPKVNPEEHPDHYTEHEHECWEEMELLFGTEWTAIWAFMTIWKYRYRAPYKGTAVADGNKSDAYLDKFLELKDKMASGNAVFGIQDGLAGLPFVNVGQ